MRGWGESQVNSRKKRKCQAKRVIVYVDRHKSSILQPGIFKKLILTSLLVNNNPNINICIRNRSALAISANKARSSNPEQTKIEVSLCEEKHLVRPLRCYNIP